MLLLGQHKIEVLVDVRSQPYSHYAPQFDREQLQQFIELLRRMGVKEIIDIRLRNSSQLVGWSRQPDFKQRGKEITYLALGLSRLYKGKHWLLVVGVHTIPALEVEIDYARL